VAENQFMMESVTRRLVPSGVNSGLDMSDSAALDCALVLFKQNTAMMLRPIYDWEMRGLLEKNLTD
jgi:hypothetical protein